MSMLVRLNLLLLKAVCVKYSECLFEYFLCIRLNACAVLYSVLWIASLRHVFYIISNTSKFQKKLKREKAS